VPSYLGFKGRANNAAAQANVRSAIPAVEAYYADDGTYVGMKATNLAPGYDGSIKVTVVSAGASYCIKNSTPTLARPTSRTSRRAASLGNSLHPGGVVQADDAEHDELTALATLRRGSAPRRSAHPRAQPAGSCSRAG
jgi:Tfp pilus assembly protein PilE